MNMLDRIKLLALRRQTGATATEYAVIIAIVAVVLLGATMVLGSDLVNFFNGVGGKLPTP
ncbi:MAG: Flp family type IVb pilin [Sinobacteraceae bacterium]|nr:Flp family type IVb pilin [Nevskiaceae bacterium]